MTESPADGWRFSSGRAHLLERAIVAKVPGTVAQEADSQFVPGSRALRVSHERVSWTLEVVPMNDDFLILLPRGWTLFSDEHMWVPARRGLSHSPADWAIETVERALRFGAVLVKRRRGAPGSFLGDDLADIERELKSGGEVISSFPSVDA